MQFIANDNLIGMRDVMQFKLVSKFCIVGGDSAGTDTILPMRCHQFHFALRPAIKFAVSCGILIVTFGFSRVLSAVLLVELLNVGLLCYLHLITQNH